MTHWCAWVGFGADTGKPRPHDLLSGGFPHLCSVHVVAEGVRSGCGLRLSFSCQVSRYYSVTLLAGGVSALLRTCLNILSLVGCVDLQFCMCVCVGLQKKVEWNVIKRTLAQFLAKI